MCHFYLVRHRVEVSLKHRCYLCSSMTSSFLMDKLLYLTATLPIVTNHARMYIGDKLVSRLFGISEIYMKRISDNSLNVWYKFFCAYQVIDVMSFTHILIGCVDTTWQILSISFIRLFQHMSIFVGMCATWFDWRQ